MKIGIIGLGIIGSIWAKHFLASGNLSGVWNRTAQPDQALWMDSPAAVAAASDVIQIVVADPSAVESVIKSIMPELKSGKFVVQSSTIDPISSERFKALVEASGAHYIEAPFTGSKPAAEAKQTVFYLGGCAEDITALEPLLSLTSAHRFHIGTCGQAATLKLAMNLNIAAQMEALSEALTLARRSGISDDTFFMVLAKNVGHSGLVTLKEQKLRTRDFSPQFSVKHMHKDMRLASIIGSDLPILNAVRGQFANAESSGLADQDFSSLVDLL